jgi:non-specific protein-tyrosine kinase
VDLPRLITVVRAWFPLIVVTTLLAGGAAFVVSSLQERVYEAKATLIVGQSLTSSNPDFTQLLVAQGLSETYAAIAKTSPILERVIEELGLEDSLGELSARVRVEAPRDTSFLIISARDTDPDRAAAIANGLGDQLIAASPAIQGRQADVPGEIEQDLAATRDLIEGAQAQLRTLSELEERTPQQEADLQELVERLVDLRSTYAILLSYSSGGESNVVTIVEPASAPTVPVSPSTLLNTLLAAALGLMVVAGIAFLTEQFDETLKDADGVQEVAGLSTLGTIARMRGAGGRSELYRVVTLLYPRSSIAEAYRTLRVNVEFAALDAPVHTLLVTSTTPGEGKSVTSANLAVAFAQAGSRVLLVDADLRKPGVHALFDLPNNVGLTTMIRGDAVEPEVLSQPTEQANLRILTTGSLPPNPAELLGSQRMRAVLEHLRKSADLVIFDSPPLQAVTDAAVLSAFVDGTLLVVRAGHSKRGPVRNARETLTRAGANVLGVVLNGVAVKESAYYAGYGASDGASAAHPLVPAESQDYTGTSRMGTGGR